jgi:hypothetical protein
MSQFLSPASPGFLDLDVALSQIGDVEAMNDMLVMLQTFLSREVPQIASLLQQHDTAGASQLLHALKGFIPIFCPETFCHEVGRVEGLSKAADSAALVMAYASLQPQLEQLLAEVSAYLVRHGPAS